MTHPVMPQRPAAPSLPPALDQMYRRMLRLEAEVARLKRGARTAQLGFTTVENGTITYNDANGNPVLISGLQPDGTIAHAAVSGTDQAAPSDPAVAPDIGSLIVIWDGQMADGTDPAADNGGVQVHASPVAEYAPDSTTLQGVLSQGGMFRISGLTADVTYYVSLVAQNTAGQPGGQSEELPGVPASVPDSIPAGAITGGPSGMIAPGTVTVDNLAAGLVVAGIVDGTLIQGAQLIAYGGNGEFLGYAGAPGAGNLSASISTSDSTDQFGNAYIHGMITYGVSGSTYYAQGWQDGGQVFATASSQAGPYVTASGALRSIGSYANSFTSGTDINGATYPVTVTQTDAHTIVMAGRIVLPAGWTSGLTFGTIGAPFLLPASGANVPEFPTVNTAGGSSGSIVVRPNGNLQIFSNQFAAGYTVITAGALRF